MPRVPSSDSFVNPNIQPDTLVSHAATGAEMSYGARQLAQQGKALEGVSNTATSIEVDMQDRANQVRVADALNQARQKAQELAYNPSDGYLKLKGGDALNRPNGVALPEEYGEKLGTTLSDLSGGLGNDEQRRQFNMQAAQLHTSFQGDVEHHMLTEYTNYHQSVADGAEKLSVQDAQLNWDNPQKVSAAIDGVADPVSGVRYGGVKQSIYQKGQLSGLSGNEIEAAQKDAESNIHAKVIESALTNSDPTYAMQYFQQNKTKMTGDDVLKIQGQINHQMDGHVAITATTASTKKYSSSFLPSDMDRLTNIVQSQESSGRRYGADGKLIEGPVTKDGTTAKGEMQVMDKTNLDPGFGVKPAQDDSPEERARVGRDYLSAMVTKYGDVGQALAAYNAGPSAVDDAMKEAVKLGKPTEWLSLMPKETQAYVTNGTKSFGSGSGSPPLPTKMEFISDAVARLGDNPRLETLTATREQAEKQYELLITSRKEQGDQALAQAQKELIANGGDFNALSPKTTSDLSRYDPGKYDDAFKFGKSIKNGENTTNMDAFANAVTYPSELANMNDVDFVQFLKTNFSSRDQEKIANLRANQINGNTTNSADGLNNTALNVALTNKLDDLQIQSKPKNTDKAGRERIGAIQKFVRDDIFDQQQQLGRKMSPVELEERLDTLFAKSVDLPGVLWGTNTENLMSMQPGSVPADARAGIVKQFNAFGIAKPSESDILRAYWKNKVKNAG